ncbi:PREDICTED: unnamed product [Prunus dulcis]|uniref:PREDICTED: unnamed product n=2 Tax=Prunus dulcis TaxID=3755 RepID=A0A5E4E9L2_PRUDU|nr:PREDICTED: unnamed product [Prunus dulcis]
MATSNTTSVSLKLLIDTKGGKVLFAEASKDVVDFLFTLLSLPVGTVIRLLSKDAMVGTLGKLYESVENISYTYLQPNLKKDTLLKPKAAVAVAGSNILLLLTNDVDSNAKQFYICAKCNRHISDVSGTVCPSCRYPMSTQVTYVCPQASSTVAATSGEGGYVKGVVTYMIMDNLEVKPMSTISSIAMLNQFNVKEVGALEEKVVYLGMDEGLKLLKASLETSTVLTNVFLGNKMA